MLDYLAPPGPTSKVLRPEFRIDFQNRRAIVLEGEDSLFTLTTIKDLANIVARAIELEGEWPIDGGIHGATLPTSKILEIGARVRGMLPKPLSLLIGKSQTR